MGKDSMVIYREWKEVLQEYSFTERCMAYEAIMDYAFDGNMPKDPLIKGITALMRQRIDKDQAKYQETCTKRAEAGKLGGQKRAANRRNQANEANATNSQQMLSNDGICKQTKQTQANVANQAEYDNDNDILASKEAEYNISLLKEGVVEKFILENQITVEGICKNEKLSLEEFRTLAQEVVLEWTLDNWTIAPIPKGNGDFTARHLINEIKFRNQKKRNKQNVSNGEDRFSRRRGTDSSAWKPEDFKETL